jgi:hypothetical protein
MRVPFTLLSGATRPFNHLFLARLQTNALPLAVVETDEQDLMLGRTV